VLTSMVQYIRGG